MKDAPSYTAANSLPVKLLQDLSVVRRVKDGFVPPVHVQLIPTNRCNLNCSFCSCSERNRKDELELNNVFEIMRDFKGSGCKSVTITGGGEPFLHPHINPIIGFINRILDIRVGIVTNGTQFSKFYKFGDVTWCRISSSDDRNPDWSGIADAVRFGRNIDWAFSHVLTRSPNWQVLKDVVEFSNLYSFTHVRVVGDLLDIDASAQKVQEAKVVLKSSGVDDRLVIYQDRAAFTTGRPRCLISLLKPVVGADGKIYPCCGAQYAQDVPGRDLVEFMSMGRAKDLNKIWADQKFFDGTVCSKCYYDDYNNALNLLGMKLTHKEFV